MKIAGLEDCHHILYPIVELDSRNILLFLRGKARNSVVYAIGYCAMNLKRKDNQVNQLFLFSLSTLFKTLAGRNRMRMLRIPD